MSEPSPTELLIAFLQTGDDGDDPLAAAPSAAAWLSAHGLMAPDEPATDDEARMARRARAALRSLLASHAGQELDSRTMPALDAVTERSPLRVTFEANGGVFLAPVPGGIPGALAGIMALVYRASIDGTLSRYKACKQCGWAFYDSSKNRSRVWCDMATCGSQVKARSYRARQKDR